MKPKRKNKQYRRTKEQIKKEEDEMKRAHREVFMGDYEDTVV